MTLNIQHLKALAKADAIAYDEFKRLIWEYVVACGKCAGYRQIIEALQSIIGEAGLTETVADAIRHVEDIEPFSDPPIPGE